MQQVLPREKGSYRCCKTSLTCINRTEKTASGKLKFRKGLLYCNSNSLEERRSWYERPASLNGMAPHFWFSSSHSNYRQSLSELLTCFKMAELKFELCCICNELLRLYMRTLNAVFIFQYGSKSERDKLEVIGKMDSASGTIVCLGHGQYKL